MRMRRGGGERKWGGEGRRQEGKGRGKEESWYRCIHGYRHTESRKSRREGIGSLEFLAGMCVL